MSVGHFADGDRLDGGAGGDEPRGLHLDAGRLRAIRAIRRRSWVGSSLVISELASWIGQNSAVEPVAHFAALGLAIALGIDFVQAGAVRCYNFFKGRVFIVDFREQGQRERRRGQGTLKWVEDQPDQRE